MNSALASREQTLLIIFLGMALGFGLTDLAVRAYRAMQETLAQEWSNQAELELNEHSYKAAVQSYQTALIYSRDNTSYQFKLAEALLGADRFTEAKSYLETLWEREPGSGLVNLELGRLALRDHDYASSITYFHNAIYGVWDQDPDARRREVRLELIQLLLDHGSKDEAQAELIALAANLPNDAAWRSRVGVLFMTAGNYNRALQEFDQALRIAPDSETALTGAGEASYQMGDYSDAQRYLQSATRANPSNAETADMLRTASLVLELDASARHISDKERADRILRGFDLVSTRLQDCSAKHSGNSPIQETLSRLQARAAALRPKMRLEILRRDSDLGAAALDLIDQVEVFTAEYCGKPTGGDLALLLLAHHHEKIEP